MNAIVIDIFNDQVLQCTVVIQVPYSKVFIHRNTVSIFFKTGMVRFLMRVAFECLAGTEHSYTPSTPPPAPYHVRVLYSMSYEIINI